MTGKLLLITIASLFFWRATVLGADYEKKTQMTVLPTPIDFSQTVFAEAETYANVAFWHLSFDTAGKPTNDAFSEVVVDRVPVKALYTIHSQEVPRAAIVTISADDGSHTGKREEKTYTFNIAKFEDRNVILFRYGDFGIVVLTFNGTIGSFTQTYCNAWDFWYLNRSETLYGTCRN